MPGGHIQLGQQRPFVVRTKIFSILLDLRRVSCRIPRRAILYAGVNLAERRDNAEPNILEKVRGPSNRASSLRTKCIGQRPDNPSEVTNERRRQIASAIQRADLSLRWRQCRATKAVSTLGRVELIQSKIRLMNGRVRQLSPEDRTKITRLPTCDHLSGFNLTELRRETLKKRLAKDPSLPELEEVKENRCPICGSKEVSDIVEVKLSSSDNLPFAVVTSDIPIIFSCNSCGYEWANPQYEDILLSRVVGL